jgi:tRNA(Ile)-lysidine synthase
MLRKHSKLAQQVLAHIRAEGLVRAGERVGAAVSGGADSVALLRLLLELRQELGIVLAVAHFDHKIRGEESRADAEFVAKLAKEYDVELFVASGETPAYAREQKMTLEEAGRHLRHSFFASLMETGGPLDKVATAHTLDDQAETVLMRLLRGTGPRGLGGIQPQIKISDENSDVGAIVRPLLRLRRAALRDYLKSIAQDWREDKSNLDVKHLRNRVRHELLPMLEKNFNPRVAEVLAHTAKIARAEEEFWKAELVQATRETIYGPHGDRLDVNALLRKPLALQRRILLAATATTIGAMDFEHLERLRGLVHEKATAHPKRLQVPGGEARLLRGEDGRVQLLLLPEQENATTKSQNQDPSIRAPSQRSARARSG